jgi:hypothetical protein
MIRLILFASFLLSQASAQAQGTFMFSGSTAAREEDEELMDAIYKLAARKPKPAVPRAVSPNERTRPSPDRYADRSTEAAAPCVGCSTSRARPVVRSTPRVAASSISFRNRGKNIGAACRNQFVGGDGSFGPVGRQIENLIRSEPYRRYFFNNNSLRAICPRYPSLSVEEKTQAWVWFWMVLANEESSCNASLPHATHYPDGRRLNPRPGYGLFAAELYPQHRNWRGPMCQGNIRYSSTQVNCAVHTMAATQLARGRGILWSESYWGPVRRVGRQIMPNMRGYHPCF